MGFVIALPKGRLGEDAEIALLRSGIISDTIPKNSRKLIFDLGNDIKALLVRAWDVPSYVEAGTADIGVCGKDDLLEHEAELFELLDMKFGYCRMALAAKDGVTREELFMKPFLRVASKYTTVSRKYFSSLSIQAEIIKLYGSVELAAVTGMSDCIVDLVSTGNTLRENGLSVMDTIFESTARLVVNRASFYRGLDGVENLIMKLSEYMKTSGEPQ